MQDNTTFKLTRMEPAERSPNPLADLGQVRLEERDVDYRPRGLWLVDSWRQLTELLRYVAWTPIVFSGDRRRKADYVRTLPWLVVDVDGLTEAGGTEQDLIRVVESWDCPALIITTKTRGRYRVLAQTEREMSAAEHLATYGLYCRQVPGYDDSCLALEDWYFPCVKAGNPDSGKVVFLRETGTPLAVMTETAVEEPDPVSNSLPLPVYRHESPTDGNHTDRPFQGTADVSDALSFALKAKPALSRADKSVGVGTRNSQLFKVGMAIAKKLFETDSLDSFEAVYGQYAARCNPRPSEAEIRGMGRRLRQYAFEGNGKYKPWTKKGPKAKLSSREAGIRRAEGRRLARLRRERESVEVQSTGVGDLAERPPAGAAEEQGDRGAEGRVPPPGAGMAAGRATATGQVLPGRGEPGADAGLRGRRSLQGPERAVPGGADQVPQVGRLDGGQAGQPPADGGRLRGLPLQADLRGAPGGREDATGRGAAGSHEDIGRWLQAFLTEEAEAPPRGAGHFQEEATGQAPTEEDPTEA